MPILTVNPDSCPKPIGPYSVAKVFNGVAFVSGQIPLNEKGELVSESVQAETHQVLKNMGLILKDLGCGYEQVLKVGIFLVDMADFGTVNEIYGQYFKENPPARFCIAVKQLPKGARVEMDMTVATNASL